MLPSNHPKSNVSEDEIDLMPFLQALLRNKIVIIATTIAGAIISLSIHALSPEQWTASTYLSKPSLLAPYNEAIASIEKHTLLEPKILSTLQSDIFYTAIGTLTAHSVHLKQVMPSSRKDDPVLYIASFTADTKELAKAKLNTALNQANSNALALNLSTPPSEHGLKAFNLIDDVKVINNENAKALTLLGAVLGFILGSSCVIASVLLRQYRSATQP
ncbi:Wzz/FepE/Etk N-terminal domain-containing protein [Pseudomonas sp. SDO5271_S396]